MTDEEPALAILTPDDEACERLVGEFGMTRLVREAVARSDYDLALDLLTSAGATPHAAMRYVLRAVRSHAGVADSTLGSRRIH